jgi:hypothetical protein
MVYKQIKACKHSSILHFGTEVIPNSGKKLKPGSVDYEAKGEYQFACTIKFFRRLS